MRTIKAVIAVAGTGTRFFPLAKSINKCMLPVLDHPVLDYAVADCVAAGAQDIAIVTAPGPTGAQVRHYLSHDQDLEAFFTGRGWQHKYTPIAGLHTRARFHFVEQPRSGRYGTALPVMLAAEWIDGQDFLVVAGDDLLLRTDGGHDLADLALARATAGTGGAIAAATVPGRDAHRYGILRTRTGTPHLLLDGIDEKPADHPGPTAHVNISRAFLPGHATAYFEKLTPSSATGEYQATDAIEAFARDHDVVVHPVTGRYFDCGNPTGWLAANNAADNAADSARADGP